MKPNTPTPDQLKAAVQQANKMQREVMGLSSSIEEVLDRLVNVTIACAYEGDEESADANVQAERQAIQSINKLIEQETIKARKDELTTIAREHWQQPIPEAAVLARVRALEEQLHE